MKKEVDRQGDHQEEDHRMEVGQEEGEDQMEDQEEDHQQEAQWEHADQREVEDQAEDHRMRPEDTVQKKGGWSKEAPEAGAGEMTPLAWSPSETENSHVGPPRPCESRQRYESRTDEAHADPR
jgi:hypothetical protein